MKAGVLRFSSRSLILAGIALGALSIPLHALAQYPPISIQLEQTQNQNVTVNANPTQTQTQGQVGEDTEGDDPVEFRDVFRSDRTRLPATGSDAFVLGTYGLALLGGGSFLIAVTRRRRNRFAFADAPTGEGMSEGSLFLPFWP